MKKLILILLLVGLYSCDDNVTEPTPDPKSFLIDEELQNPLLSFDDFEIIDYAPKRGMQGTVVSITGKAFGLNKDSVSVFFGETESEIVALNDTLIQVEVPEIDPGRYKLFVNVKDTTVTWYQKFIIESSIYALKEVYVNVNNFYTEKTRHAYGSDDRYGLWSKTKKDSSIRSHRFDFSEGLFDNLSKGSHLLYIHEIYHEMLNYKIAMDIYPNDKKVYNIYLSKNEDYSENNENIVNVDLITIKEAQIDIFSDTLIQIRIDSKGLRNTDYSFTKSSKSTLSYPKSSSTDSREYKLLSITDSSEIVISLWRK